MSINLSEATEGIRSFLIEAGNLAVQQQATAKVSYKEGNQALTNADLEISALARTSLAKWLTQPGHILIDEETASEAALPLKVFSTTQYQWVLDPIDGTAGYALGRHLWGITLGLLENGRPISGGIYLPAQNSMLLTDGTKAWQIKNVGLATQSTSLLTCKELELHSQIFVESYVGKIRPYQDLNFKKKVWLNTPESAVQGAFSTLVLEAAGFVMDRRFSLWDIAAAVAIGKAAGFSIRSMETGNAVECFSASDFSDDWKLSQSLLLCAEKNFSTLCDIIMNG